MGLNVQKASSMVKTEIFQRIQSELEKNHIVLFMKGTPAAPKCGFSASASERLNKAGVKYKSVDVLSDPALYDGIRQYTNYTHFPQIFVDGRFIGSNENIDKYLTLKKS